MLHDPKTRNGRPRDPNSLLGRIRTYMAEHPDATAPVCAKALGETVERVRNSAKNVISFRSPVRAEPVTGHRNKGAAKAAAIRHRAAQRPAVEAKIEALPALLPEEGVDVTALVGIMDLTRDTCRWPHGDPLQAGFGFCGQQIKEGSPYCPAHHRRAYPVRAPA